MNTLRALLWKEGRAAACRVAACACLALLAGVAHIDWVSPLLPLGHLVGVLGAVLMGMDLVAGERSRGTLPFLSNLPLRTAWLLGVKYAVGAAGLLAVLAAYWAGVYLGMPHWEDWSMTGHPLEDLVAVDVLRDVGYGRMLLLWYLFYLILYSVAFLSSTLCNRPSQAVWTSLLIALGYQFIRTEHLSDPVSAFLLQVLENGLHDGLILRPAFDPTLLFSRAATAFLLAGCVLVWTCRTFQTQGSRRFPWIMSALVLICLAGSVRWSTPEHESVEPVGRLPYEESVVDLALKDGMAIVLLTRGLSVVDVTDRQAPREIGRVGIAGFEPRRLALSASTAYVWGWAGKRDSAGVAVFDLNRPDRPLLQTLRFLHPIESDPTRLSQSDHQPGGGPVLEVGTTRFLRHTPRLTAWSVRDGYLYAGLLGSEFLELHSFDVRRGGLPQPVQVLRIAETARHVWNDNWQIHIAGENAFCTLGYDFVALDLTDPAAMKELSRTPVRFGPSRLYEQYAQESEAFYLQLSQLPEIAMDLGGGRELVYLEKNKGPMGSQRSHRIPVPRALGPISLVGERAYVPRYRPRELAVLDIGDPRRPVEVDHLPWRSDTQLIQDGEVVYALSRTLATWPDGHIEVYGVDQNGTVLSWSRPRKRLQLLDETGEPAPISSRTANTLIPVDDHFCTVIDFYNLAIFKAPRVD